MFSSYRVPDSPRGSSWCRTKASCPVTPASISLFARASGEEGPSPSDPHLCALTMRDRKGKERFPLGTNSSAEGRRGAGWKETPPLGALPPRPQLRRGGPRACGEPRMRPRAGSQGEGRRSGGKGNGLITSLRARESLQQRLLPRAHRSGSDDESLAPLDRGTPGPLCARGVGGREWPSGRATGDQHSAAPTRAASREPGAAHGADGARG